MRATFKCRFLAALCGLGLFFLTGEGRAALSTNFQARAQAAFAAAEKAWSQNSTNYDAKIALARTVFDLAEFAEDKKERERLADIGIRAARAAIETSRERVEGHYYLAMNLGQLARTKMLSALKILDEMEAEWSAARAIDPKYDYAGPDRSLGILYLEAPGWPTSVGNKKKARFHLERAVTLAPNCPENLISLMEAYVKWKDWSALEKRMKEYEKLLPAARKEFVGEEWDYEWSQWEQRWEFIQSKARRR